MHVAFLPMIVQILHAGRARNIASCCANKNALCQSSSTSYVKRQRIVCWRAMQHSELAAGLSFGSVLCRRLLLFRCSNLPWKHKHARAWIAALSMRGDVSAQDSAWPPKPVKMMFISVCDSPAIAINICLSVYNSIEAVLYSINHEHQWRQKDNRNKRCWQSHRWRYLMLYVLVGNHMWFLRMSGIYGNSSYYPNRMARPPYTHWGWLAHLINCCMSKYCTLVEVCEA